MLNFIEHLTNEDNVIGIYCYDIAPYNIETLSLVQINEFFLY